MALVLFFELTEIFIEVEYYYMTGRKNIPSKLLSVEKDPVEKHYLEFM